MSSGRVYTKVGDWGMTSLADGSKASKTDVRVEAYGSVDELNAHIGLAVAMLWEKLPCCDGLSVLQNSFKMIQSELFQIGSELALADHMPSKSLVFSGLKLDSVERLEKEMDEFSKSLEELKNFILPGGCALVAQLHVARTVCRRAERVMWSLKLQESVREEVGVYMNRLSDWLFVVARFSNGCLGHQEIIWRL